MLLIIPLINDILILVKGLIYMKKLIALLLCLGILFTVPAAICSAQEAYAVTSVEDAYEEFKNQHSDFVKSFTDYGITEELLKEFLYDIHAYISEINTHTTVTPDNFEKHALTAISTVSSREKYYSIQDAILILYPDAIRQALKYGTVSEELQPIVDTVKKIVFDYGLLENTDAVLPQTPLLTFTDLPETHWAYYSVNTLVQNLILNGYLDGTFKPDSNITRGEFAKIIVSATDTLDSSASSSFSDVSTNDWYYHYVSSAYKNGYITGYPDGSFRPDDYITRADICTIVSRSLGSPVSVSGTTFSDDASIPAYAKIPVYALVKKGIINGMGDGKFAPTAFATRAQTAKIICSAFFE